MASIDSLERKLREDWRYASTATGSGEGLSRMLDVRATQLDLAQAYQDAADLESLRKARELFVEVLSSREGLSHTRHLGSLRRLLEQLAEPASPTLLAIAHKHLESLEAFARRRYRPPDFSATLRFIGTVLQGVPEAETLMRRVKKLRF